MATLTQSESASISKKLEALIALTAQWDAALKSAAEANIAAIEGSEEATKALMETTAQAITSAQELIDNIAIAKDAADDAAGQITNASMAVQPGAPGFGGGSSAATNNYNPIQVVSKEGLISAFKEEVDNPYQAEINRLKIDVLNKLPGYGQKLTDKQQSMLDQFSGVEAELAIKAGEWDQLNKAVPKIIALTESLAKTKDQLDAAEIQYKNANDSIQKSFYEQKINALKDQENNISAGIEFQKELLAKYGRSSDLTATETYTSNDLIKLLKDAVAETNNEYLSSLLDKVKTDQKSNPTKTYQLDLTLGDKKLTAYSDTSPEAFINALIAAKKSSI